MHLSILSALAAAASLALFPPQEVNEKAVLEQSLERGVEYLIKNQNKDGSWGSHNTGRPIEILADVPGSHRAFKVATSALCMMALDETPEAMRSEAHKKAMERGLEYLITQSRVKRPNSAELYNVWAFGYGLQCLSTLLPKIKDPETRGRVTKAAEKLVDALKLYQTPDGGWGYFDFEYGAHRPAGSSMSFTTASILVGVKKAQEAGLEIPQKVIDRAIMSLRRARKADGSYIYGDYMKYIPHHPVNKVKGSISRTAACHIAQYYFGVDITEEDFKACLDDLLEHQHFADIGRKRPWPHESWYATSGYFYLFGHYYTALVIREIPRKDQGKYISAYSNLLFKLQDPDGSWWDYPFYRYHKAYGTAYSVMCLSIYRDLLAEP